MGFFFLRGWTIVNSPVKEYLENAAKLGPIGSHTELKAAASFSFAKIITIM